jgi:hypothetical protein
MSLIRLRLNLAALVSDMWSDTEAAKSFLVENPVSR